MAESYLSDYLPEEFIPQQKLLLYYNDLFTNMLIKADEYNLAWTEFPLNEKDEKIEETEDVIDWMIENGFKKEAYKFLRAHLFFSLLQDFNFYMHESFDCAERGKVSVAFTISRKPIKDTLFYLSWLLVDSAEMLDKFLNENPKKYDVSSLNRDFKLKILKKSVECIDLGFDESLLFKLIYDRKCEYGLSRIWDQSLHLVTTNPNYPTKYRNLNFIFSQDKIWKDFWKTYYNAIPIILRFSTEIIVKLFESIIEPDENIVFFNSHLRNIKFINATETSNSEIIEFTQELLKSVNVTCEKCLFEFPLTDKVADEVINEFLYTCPKCGNIERVGEYFNIWNSFKK
ncbi:hypothetical protein [Enterococcus sp. DIV1368c]|uniref:hypothetical protein n=1 Tax=Enterococcus sp. DIV1368c TaxID=2774815 RepID=UPI003F245E1A